jgi:predicted Rossmann fold nucleotide-binding protein DprA/Smf involved in DNA uptake
MRLLRLTSGKRWHRMHTMSETKRNPVIRVYAQTRKKLKVIAAQVGETMQETVERLAQAEVERLQRAEKPVPKTPEEP